MLPQAQARPDISQHLHGVTLTLRDGSRIRMPCATRRAAVTYLVMIPYNQVHSERGFWRDIASARLSRNDELYAIPLN